VTTPPSTMTYPFSAYAIEVMHELSVDLRTLHSKFVQSIDPATVGAVSTLCARR
jgi:hypothetical protein